MDIGACVKLDSPSDSKEDCQRHFNDYVLSTRSIVVNSSTSLTHFSLIHHTCDPSMHSLLQFYAHPCRLVPQLCFTPSRNGEGQRATLGGLELVSVDA
jgi:hypothetical protein